MTSRKLVALAVSFLLVSPSVGFAAGGDNLLGGGAYGDAPTTLPDANVENIPDLGIGGPPALDVTKDLQFTDPGTASQKTPRMTPPSRSAPPQ
jgi:hypothetical protein